MNGIFSCEQQDVLLDMHRQQSGNTGYVAPGNRQKVAYVYGVASSDEIMVVTSLEADPSGSHYADAVDLGPVGAFIHAFDGDAPYPRRPLILPRSTLGRLTQGALTPEELAEGRARVEARVAAPASPTA